MKVVTRENATFQVLESLARNRQKRQATRTCLVEGVRPIDLALAHGWTVEAFLHAHERPLSRWAAGVIDAQPNAERYALAPELLARLGGRQDGSELLAVVRMADDDLDRLPIRPDLLVVVVDRPGNPGNLGTLIRSCDAFGAHGVVVSGHGVDLYDPATITASRGSLFAVPVVRVASHRDVEAHVARVRAAIGPCAVVGADERATVDADVHDFASPTVLVLGNETRGLSHAYSTLCDTLVRIPMSGAASSLNVSMAGSVLLYEVGRQRRRGRT